MEIKLTNIEEITRLYSKPSISREYSKFLKEKRSEWDLYISTITYRSSSLDSSPRKWLSIYDVNILGKIRKELKRNINTNHNIIPFPDLRVYEFEEKSRFKRDKSNTPHHIHGILTIPKELTHKFWDMEKNTVVGRIHKDLMSISEVESYDIRPLGFDEEDRWLNYCLKGKKMDRIF